MLHIAIEYPWENEEMKTAALSSYHGFGKLFKESTKCLVIIVIVVVVFGNEKLVFFQERGHFLADLGTDAQTREHRQKNLKKESEHDFEAKSGKKEAARCIKVGWQQPNIEPRGFSNNTGELSKGIM